MEEAARTHYENAGRELELAAVLVQPKDAAQAYRTAAAEMDAAGDYRDARKLAAEYRERADRIEEEGREALYQAACRTMDGAKNTAQRKLAMDMFGQTDGYRDAAALAEKCLEENKKEVRRKDILTVCAVLVAALAVMLAVWYWRSPMNAYRRAQELFAQERYESAATFYKKAGDYKDSAEMLRVCEEKTEETES